MRLQKHRTLQFLLQKVTNEITKSDHYIGHYNFLLQKVTNKIIKSDHYIGHYNFYYKR